MAMTRTEISRRWREKNRDRVRANKRRAYRRLKERVAADPVKVAAHKARLKVARVKYQKSEKGRSRIRAYKRARYAAGASEFTSPQSREVRRAAVDRYYATDHGKAKKRVYEQSEHGRAIIRAGQRRFAKTEKGREWMVRGAQKRRARCGDVPRTLTAAEWQEILDRYDCRCRYCKRSGIQLTRDHVFPISLGGWHVKENVVPACRSCNAARNNRIGWPWRQVFKTLGMEISTRIAA